MTKEQARTTAEALQAFADGKPGLYEGSQNGQYWYKFTFPDTYLETYFYYRFTPEKTATEKRLEENAKLKAEYEKEAFAVEYRHHHYSPTQWKTAKEWITWCWDTPYMEYRRKSEPKVEPWTFENSPTTLKVRRKSDGAVFTAACLVMEVPLYVDRLSGSSKTYRQLAEEFVQLNGSPCGTTTEGDK